MKRNSLILIIVISILCITLFACGNPEPNTTTETIDDKVTVSWYNGTTIIHTDKVNKGSVINSWEPQNGSYVFIKWCVDSELTQEFIFPKTINENTNIYAEFKGPKIKDTRKWYIIGEGQGTLKNNPNNVNELNLEYLLKEVDDDNTNKYVINNLTLYAGDKFVFHKSNTWEEAHGIGFAKGYDPVTKNINIGGQEFFKSAKNRQNDKECFFETVKSGVYSFYLSTNPGEERYDDISFVRHGDAAELSDLYRMHLKCKSNNFGEEEGFVNDVTYLMEKDYLTGDFLIKYVVDINDYTNGKNYAEFSIYNSLKNETIDNDGTVENNTFKLQAGEYHIKYNPKTNKVDVSKYGYYLIGSFVDGTTKVENIIKENITPMLVQNGDVYTTTITAIDVTDIYTEGFDAEKGIMFVSVAEGSEFQIEQYWEIHYLQAGTYDVTFDGVETIFSAK